MADRREPFSEVVVVVVSSSSPLGALAIAAAALCQRILLFGAAS